jgi:putative membrane protein
VPDTSISNIGNSRGGPLQPALLTVLVVAAIGSCIAPPFPKDMLLQHAPTAVAIPLLAWSWRRFPLSDASFSLVILFMTLHVLGARYIYSYVPYDEWCRTLFGFTVSERMGWERNHYDRLVHGCYGLLLAYPTREMLIRLRAVSPGWSYFFAIEFIAATSMLYELGEWIVAMTFAPDWADRYLGQQGDMWDAQEDMALATAGATLAMVLTMAMRSRSPLTPVTSLPAGARGV